MDEELESLYRWVDELPLSRPKKNISRDFSDGVMMAEILKYFYPRLIDIHNYPPTNSLGRKITNWVTLNKKILSKIGLPLKKNEIEKVAGAAEGAIENLLQSLYNKLRTEREQKLLQEEHEKNLQQHVYILQRKNQTCELRKTFPQFYFQTFGLQLQKDKIPVSGIPVKTDQRSGSRVILVTEKMVPISQVEKKSVEIAEKDETISALSSRILHYEKLLELKDQRIKDLVQQLQLSAQDSLSESFEEVNNTKLD